MEKFGYSYKIPHLSLAMAKSKVTLHAAEWMYFKQNVV